jgi:RNase adaptor protein for sRNA GlmZ degradation
MWHEFSIRVYDKQMEEMGVRLEEDSRAFVCVDTIARIYETLDDKDQRKTMIIFIDGDSMEVAEKYNDIKKLLLNANS